MKSKKEKPVPRIACLPNGPYYLLNEQQPRVVESLQNSRGEQLSTVRGVALCRCGGSRNKPFCDGTHGTNSFSGKKLANGSKDKRDNYVGKGMTIHDNRGICAHSGQCTDNLAAVFKLKTEPWIDPDGAKVEKIIETIRKCPSGALSYTGGQRYDNDQANAYSRAMPAYTVADVKLVHQTGGWILSAIAANLFDKRYFSYGIVDSFACATPVCVYPQPGRSVFASAEYRFR